MEPEAKYTLVGGSVLVLLALLVAAVAWLASASRGVDVHALHDLLPRQSLEGLQVRSDVRMKGIRVGAVTGFSFASQRPGTVEVAVGIDPGAPVRQSTRADRRAQPDHRAGDDPAAERDEDSPPIRAGTRRARSGDRRGRVAAPAVRKR